MAGFVEGVDRGQSSLGEADGRRTLLRLTHCSQRVCAVSPGQQRWRAR
jgi:hypothetical protein